MMIKKRLLTGILSVMIIFLMASCGGQKPETENDDSIDEEAVTEEVEETTQVIQSPREQAKGEIGGVKIIVDYGSPSVKGREIWGGLEPYGKVWRAGANETTSIEFDKDINLGDTKVKAGKYGVYIIPNETEDWVVILNTDWNREEHSAWGAYNYSQDHDVARIFVTAQNVEENQERLEYIIVEDGIQFAWEKVRMTIPITAS